MSDEFASLFTMNTFDEDQFAYKIHFSNNLDCDSDSDKSEFDEPYYKHKPPPMDINDDCVIVKIEPFTTVLHKRSASKILHRANLGTNTSLTQNSNIVSVSGHGNHVQSAKKTKKKKKKSGKAVVASASKVDKPKFSSVAPKASGNLQQEKNFDGPKLKKFTDYQERNPAQRPKDVKPFSLSLIEWPALDRHSSTRSRVDTLNFQPLTNTSTNTIKIVQGPQVGQKCGNIPSQTKQQKNMKSKLIFETIFQSDDSDSLRMNAEKLQNTSSLFNITNSKLISKTKTKALQSTKENWNKSQHAVPSVNFITKPEDGNINNNPTIKTIFDKMHNRNKTRRKNESDNKKSNPIAFNLSSLEWPALNKLMNENNPQQKSAGNHEINLEQEVTCTRVGDGQLKDVLKPRVSSDCRDDELKKGFWFLDITEYDCKSNKIHCDTLNNKITKPQQIQKLKLNDSLCQEISDNTEPSTVIEVQYNKGRRKAKGASEISVNNYQHTTSLSTTEKTPTNIVDINREIIVNCWRRDRSNQVSKSLIPCSSSNGGTGQKSKTKNHTVTPTQKTVASNKRRVDEYLLLLEDFFLPTFNRIPNNMGGNSIIPLNSLVTGGRDLFLLDKIVSQRFFSIYAKPHLAMSNVILHFYTGYKNEKEIVM